MIFETEEIKPYNCAEPNDKIALIDADTIAYGSCCKVEVETYDLEKGEDVYVVNVEDAYTHSVDHIERIMLQTGCKVCELYFTSGYNFRYTVEPTYKSNRKKIRRPNGLAEVKAMLCQNYEGLICTDWEADDHVVYLKDRDPDKYILCAVDKDVLLSLPGKHWNYYASTQWNIEPKWVEVDLKDSIMHNYAQAIMGDSTDGIPGVPGIGKAKVKNFIHKDMSELEIWEGVVNAYQSKGLSMIEALTTMRLVSVKQLKANENGILEIQLFNSMKELGYVVSEE